MKNVTVSLDEGLLERSREYARAQGKSFNELVREVLAQKVDLQASLKLKESLDYADELGLRLSGSLPGREERNAR